MPKNSGKDKGSLTQKADDQQVRISQVSNVNKAVSAMGKQTTARMNETERKIADGGDNREVASSMNSVLGSLKNTIDSLEKGVNAATLGTAKAAKDAFQEYGKAISADININKQNMVSTALASSTPIFGYFASKFMETGIFKKTSDSMTKGISSIFKRKSKGGSIPDDFGGESSGGGMAKSAAAAKQNAKKRKTDQIETLKIVNKDKREQYDKPFEERLVRAVLSIQNVLGGQLGKFDQWYNKFLLQHPFFRISMSAAKATAATFSAGWKAIYFFWKKRGGYAKYMSKAKRPLDAINQNIAQTFVQMMPRLDAIMIYTKATAIAIRDLSAHATGKKYPRMDPSKIAGNWSIAGVGMSIMRAIGKGAKKAANWSVKKITKPGSTSNMVLGEIVNTLGLMASGVDLAVTSPGRLKKGISNVINKSANKERKRLFGGLDEAGAGGDKEKCISVKLCTAKKKKPKTRRGQGRALMPDLIVQGVYDQYQIVHAESIEKEQKKAKKKKEKTEKKMFGWTKDIAKGMDQHNKREKRRSVWKFFGAIFSGAFSILTKLLMNPYAWVAAGLAAVGTIIVKWFHKNITPGIQSWVDKQMQRGTDGIKKYLPKKGEGRASAFDDQKKLTQNVKSSIFLKDKGAVVDTDLPYVMENHISAFKEGQLEVFSENLQSYSYFTSSEQEIYRAEYKKKWKKVSFVSNAIDMMSSGFGMGNMIKQATYENAKAEGRKFEEGFIDFLEDKKDDLSGDAKSLFSRKKKLSAKYGQDRVEAFTRRGASIGEAERALQVEDNLKIKEAQEAGVVKGGGFTAKKAHEWAAKHGGQYHEYIGRTIDQAKAIAKRYGAVFKEKAEAVGTAVKNAMTSDKAKEIATKYGDVEHWQKYADMTIEQAHKYGKSISQTIKDKAKDASDAVKGGWFSKKWQGAKDWWADKPEKIEEKAKEAKDKAKEMKTSGSMWVDLQLIKWGLYNDKGVLTGKDLKKAISSFTPEAKDKLNTDIRKSKEPWYDLSDESLSKFKEDYKKGKQTLSEAYGKGKDAYSQTKSKIQAIYDKASPEKKAWIRQHLQELLMGGESTKKALSEMGKKFTDATMEGAKKVGDTIQTATNHTVNNISSAITNSSGGGGGIGSSKLMDEDTMNNIATQSVMF